MRGTAKSDYELLQDEMRQLKRENTALQTQLSDTVTTKYHDEIVQESINERVKLTNELRNELCVAKAFHHVAVMERDALIRESASYRHQIETENKKYLEILTRWRDVMVEWYAEVDAYGMGEPNISAGLVNDTNAAVAESIKNKS